MAVKEEELTQRKASEMSTSSAVSVARVPSASAQQMYILKARDSFQALKKELYAIVLADGQEGQKESHKEAEDFVKSLLSIVSVCHRADGWYAGWCTLLPVYLARPHSYKRDRSRRAHLSSAPCSTS